MPLDLTLIPEDVIQIIFEYDGRWRKEAGKWISRIGVLDHRYELLTDLLQLQQFFGYNYQYRTQQRNMTWRIGYIIPLPMNIVPLPTCHTYNCKVKNKNRNKHRNNRNDRRYLHLTNIMECDETYKNIFNVVRRTFVSSRNRYIDSSDTDSDTDSEFIDFE